MLKLENKKQIEFQKDLYTKEAYYARTEQPIR